MEQPKNPLFDGDRVTPTRTRYINSMSIQTISNIARTSFGPKGLDKMLVDEANAITVTNDGATIFKLLDISDPAARLLATLSRSQDSAAGDGTTSVAIISGELIKLGIEKIMEGLHPSIVSSGLVKACSEAKKFIKAHLAVTPTLYSEIHSSSFNKSKEIESNKMFSDAISTSLNSKIVNVHLQHFAPLISEAVAASPIDSPSSVQVLLRMGQAVENSRLLEGYALPSIPLNEKIFNDNENNNGGKVRGKVILVSADFQPRRFGLGIKINLDDPSMIDEVKRKEKELPIKTLEKLQKAGVKGIISSAGFSSESIRTLERLGMFAVKRADSKRVKEISDMTSCRIFGNLDAILDCDLGERLGKNDPLNFCEIEVEQELVDEGSILLIRDQKKGLNPKSLLIRGPNEYVLEEVERSVHDALCVGFKLKSKKNFQDGEVVAGGGSVETATAVYLEQLAETYSSKIKIPLVIFANALMSVPETLAINSGLNVADVISDLKSSFRKSLTRSEINENDIGFKYKGVGVSNKEPIVDNMIERGIVEPLMSKLKILELATEAALSILRVDESIKLYPKKEPQKK